MTAQAKVELLSWSMANVMFEWKFEAITWTFLENNVLLLISTRSQNKRRFIDTQNRVSATLVLALPSIKRRTLKCGGY